MRGRMSLLLLCVIAAAAICVGLFTSIRSEVYLVSPATTFAYLYLPLLVGGVACIGAFVRPWRSSVVIVLVSVGFATLLADLYLASAADQKSKEQLEIGRAHV